MTATLTPTSSATQRTPEMASAALDSIRQAIVWTDGEGRIIGANAAFDALLERPPGQIIGQPLLELTPLWRNGKRVSRDDHPVSRTMRGEFGPFGDFEIAKRGAVRRWLEIVAVPARDGDGAIFTGLEITEQQLARQDLQRNSAQLELLQDVAFASNNSLSLCDAMHYSLSRLAEYEGWLLGHIWLSAEGREELTPADLWHCMDWERFGPFMEATRGLTFPVGVGLPGRVLARARPTWVADVQSDENFPRQAAAAGCGLRGAFAFPVFSGSEVVAVLELFGDRVLEPDEHLLMVVEQMGALLGRVAERETAAIQKRKTQEQLEHRVLERTAALEQLNSSLQREVEQRRQAERVKDELVATVSHELRTPLAGIRGFTELLLNRDFPKPRSQEMLGVILKESIRLTELIDDLLDVQRLAVGKLTYHFEEDVDLPAIVREAVHGARAQTAQHSIEIRDTPQPPRVRGDPKRIRQVLNNLLSNAIRYSPDGGAIAVSVERKGDRVKVAVADEGLGIPADVIGKLFTKFYRVDNTATRSINGTGLGLALIKSIVEDHGGDVCVESVEGQGSVFSFRLPLNEPDKNVRPH